MTQHAKDAPLTADMVLHPEFHSLAVCVHDDAMDVAIMSKTEDNSLIWRHIPFDSAAASVCRAFEDAVYANPLLLVPELGSKVILIDTPRFLVIPEERADEDSVAGMLADIYPAMSMEVFASSVGGGAVIATAVDSRVAGFIGRSFPGAVVAHRLVPLCRYFGAANRTGNSGKMHVHLRRDTVDVIAFEGGRLLMANTFSAPHVNDVLYFTVAAARSLDFDDTSDRMLVSGDAGRRQLLAQSLCTYIPGAVPAIFPSDMFRAGRDAMDAPFELMALPFIS